MCAASPRVLISSERGFGGRELRGGGASAPRSEGAPDRERSDASRPAEPHRDAPALHDERDAPLASGQREEALHRLGVLLHVEVLDPHSSGAVIPTGGGGVASGVLPVDLHGLAHRAASFALNNIPAPPRAYMHFLPGGPAGAAPNARGRAGSRRHHPCSRDTQDASRVHRGARACPPRSAAGSGRSSSQPWWGSLGSPSPRRYTRG
jgi:hypothetical protein